MTPSSHYSQLPEPEKTPHAGKAVNFGIVSTIDGRLKELPVKFFKRWPLKSSSVPGRDPALVCGLRHRATKLVAAKGIGHANASECCAHDLAVKIKIVSDCVSSTLGSLSEFRQHIHNPDTMLGGIGSGDAVFVERARAYLKALGPDKVYLRIDNRPIDLRENPTHLNQVRPIVDICFRCPKITRKVRCFRVEKEEHNILLPELPATRI